MRRGAAIQLGQHHAWLCPRPLRLAVDLKDAAHARREVQDDGVVDALPGEAGAAATRQHRHAGFGGHFDGMLDVVGARQ